MIYQMLVALILNMNSTIFFFYLPYRITDLGGVQKIVSLISVLHSFTYIFVTGLCSRKNIDGQKSSKNVRRLLACFMLVYLLSGLITGYKYYYFIGILHGICLGAFWPIFWSGYNAGRKKSLLLSTSIIFINATSIIAPVLAGKLYIYLGQYLMLVPVTVSGIILLLYRPIQLSESRWMNKRKESVEKKFFVRKRTDPGKAIADISFFRPGQLLLIGWSSIFVTGYLEGIIRSASAIYLMKYHIGSEIWGVMLSLKILAHTITICIVRYLGEQQVVFYKLKRKWFCFAGLMVTASLMMQMTGNIWILYLGMIGLGIGNGMFQFICLYAGSQIAEQYRKNVNGIAESITGIGILTGSFLSGYTFRNPFLMPAVLSLIVAIMVLSIKDVSIKRKGEI